LNKREVLAATTFGQRIAEDEADALKSYFVETEEWRKVVSGAVDVVYGPKGSGKSALYALLRKNQDELYKQHNIILAPGENVRGTPVFEALVADPRRARNNSAHPRPRISLSVVHNVGVGPPLLGIGRS
jgi:hypothetical protein